MRRTGSIALVVVFLSCTTPPHSRRPSVAFAAPAADPPQRFARADSAIIVALDGVRWQDVFGEDLPTLHRWMTTEGATVGAPGHGEMWSSGPNFVSLPGYTEILTGRPSACQTNQCAAIDAPTIVDEVLDHGGDAAVVASWEILEQAAAREPRRAAVSVGRHHVEHPDLFDARLLEVGRAAGPWPGSGDYRPDALTARVALELFARHVPKLAFVGLGDTDEWAHHGDRRRYLASLRAADAFLGDLEKRVGDHAAILVTADHGRNAAFRDHGGGWHESGRVWLIAKGAGIEARGSIDEPMHHLADIAPTVRCLLGLPPVTALDSGEAIAPLCTNYP